MNQLKARLSNGDKNPAWFKDYYLKNRERILAKNREYAKTHKCNSERNYTKMVVSLLRQRDGDSCGICGLHTIEGEEEIDHIVPIAIGGLVVDATNLQLAHKSCNRSKKRS
jgi:5-methylcytosine-specific restriction endonuclease McrA